MSGPGVRLQFFSAAADFLAAAGHHLAADPVTSTVVTTMAHRAVQERAQGVTEPERNWWLAVRDDTGAVAGAAMRTATFAPYPLFVLPMPPGAAGALARVLSERGEKVLGVNGVLPVAQECAAELARWGGGRVEVAHHTRLHELTEVVAPSPVPGRLVAATEDDVELATAWFEAFMGDADEQAGRLRGVSAHSAPDRTDMLRRIRSGRLWFWADPDGARVHLTGANPPAFNVARIGPVYTPPDQRGRGWASNAVAEVSRRILAGGARPCLYTDQANPTSNKIYAAVGYRPVVDMVDLLIV